MAVLINNTNGREMRVRRRKCIEAVTSESRQLRRGASGPVSRGTKTDTKTKTESVRKWGLSWVVAIKDTY